MSLDVSGKLGESQDTPYKAKVAATRLFEIHDLGAFDEHSLNDLLYIEKESFNNPE